MILLGQVKAGIDPADQRDAARRARTVKELGKRFLEQYVPTRCKPTTASEYKRSVELFINPKLGTRRLADIVRADVSELHYEMRDIPYQANRTLSVLSKMFNLAEKWGLRSGESNPCRQWRDALPPLAARVGLRRHAAQTRRPGAHAMPSARDAALVPRPHRRAAAER
jgi:hypothetical protein